MNNLWYYYMYAKKGHSLLIASISNKSVEMRACLVFIFYILRSWGINLLIYVIFSDLEM